MHKTTIKTDTYYLNTHFPDEEVSYIDGIDERKNLVYGYEFYLPYNQETFGFRPDGGASLECNRKTFSLSVMEEAVAAGHLKEISKEDAATILNKSFMVRILKQICCAKS